MSIGDFIKEETRLPNYEIAKFLDSKSYNYSYIYRILNGKSQPTLCMFFNICKDLGIDKVKIAQFYANYNK